VLLAAAQPASADGRIYTVGIVPQFETSRLHGIWRPILDRLESETGLKFVIRGSSTIPQFEIEFAAGQF
ncbi:MAG: phosphate ABC transporter, partial [Arenicellales bacterium]